VRNSVISPQATVAGANLFGSIIGERAAIEGSYQTLTLGDDSMALSTKAGGASIDETFK